MLDDFKTELKRLGIKRIQQEEMRRQSVALILDETDKDRDQELEFADALNANPNRLAQANDISPTNTNQDGRLRHDSMEGKPQLARAGKKIRGLPGLKSFGFNGKKSRNKKDKDPEKQETPVDDAKEDDSSRSSTERVRRMKRSLAGPDFQTVPAGY